VKGKTRIRFWLILAAVLAVVIMAAPTFGADQSQDDLPGPLDQIERGPAPIVGADRPNAIPGQYIVVFEKGARGRAVNAAAQGAERGGGQVLHRYDRVLNGFAIRAPEQALEGLRHNPNVAYIEVDQTVTVDVTWGLDRIDQRNLPLNNVYAPNGNGSGVHAYIIDTGIRSTHNEYAGRVGNGYDAVDGGAPDDCNGHGTHVAGTVGGTTYGVAPAVTIHGVRVLNCSGSGSNSGVIAGVNWVTNNHQDPAVANMSLGGSPSSALDSAVNNSISAGVTYAIAAGNSNANACNYSPARVGAALTVGATTSSDARSSFSNYGTCVDIFAPGSSITSAWYTSNSATNTISGTSMASPHVAGAAALYLGNNPGASPSTVASALINNATTGVLSGVGSGSPNRLLYVGGGAPPPGPTPTPSPTPPPGGDPCTGCEKYTGSLSGAGDSDVHPNGTYYYSSSGDGEGWLQGPAGTDFDLYLYRWNGFFWSQVASSISSSSTEHIYYNGSAGYYYWRVTSYSGSGSYTFWLDR
jgi:subtilisin family serine protease